MNKMSPEEKQYRVELRRAFRKFTNWDTKEIRDALNDECSDWMQCYHLGMTAEEAVLDDLKHLEDDANYIGW